MIRAALLSSLMLLAGCAALAPRVPAPAPVDPREARWTAHRALVGAVDDFTLSGRIAIQRGAEGGGARLHWRQSGELSDLRVMAPMAQGTFRLQGEATKVVLTAPDGRRHEAPDFEALMAAHLGWSFPVEGARFWVRGIPDPAAPVDNLNLDAEGRLRDLAQSGWRISVLDYREIDGRTLPARLFLNAGELQIRLVIDTWQLTNS